MLIEYTISYWSDYQKWSQWCLWVVWRRWMESRDKILDKNQVRQNLLFARWNSIFTFFRVRWFWVWIGRAVWIWSILSVERWHWMSRPVCEIGCGSGGQSNAVPTSQPSPLIQNHVSAYNGRVSWVEWREAEIGGHWEWREFKFEFELAAPRLHAVLQQRLLLRWSHHS